jgi:hypothetical protein
MLFVVFCERRKNVSFILAFVDYYYYKFLCFNYESVSYSYFSYEALIFSTQIFYAICLKIPLSLTVPLNHYEIYVVHIIRFVMYGNLQIFYNYIGTCTIMELMMRTRQQDHCMYIRAVIIFSSNVVVARLQDWLPSYVKSIWDRPIASLSKVTQAVENITRSSLTNMTRLSMTWSLRNSLE